MTPFLCRTIYSRSKIESRNGNASSQKSQLRLSSYETSPRSFAQWPCATELNCCHIHGLDIGCFSIHSTPMPTDRSLICSGNGSSNACRSTFSSSISMALEVIAASNLPSHWPSRSALRSSWTACRCCAEWRYLITVKNNGSRMPSPGRYWHREMLVS